MRTNELRLALNWNLVGICMNASENTVGLCCLYFVFLFSVIVVVVGHGVVVVVAVDAIIVFYFYCRVRARHNTKCAAVRIIIMAQRSPLVSHWTHFIIVACMRSRICERSTERNNMQRIKIIIWLISIFFSSLCFSFTDDHRRGSDANELIIVSDDEEKENVENDDVIQRLRNRLKKYLYYPNKKGNDPSGLNAHPTVIELSGTPDMHWNCERCGKLIRNQSNRVHRRQRALCRICRFSMRRNGKLSTRLKIPAYHLTRSQCRRQRIHVSPMPLQSATLKRSERSGNRINIFKKLQQLGTSIYYENNECPRKQTEFNHHMTSIPHEMDTSEQKTTQPNTAWKPATANESNEILMTFNTVVTEVFPIQQLYSYYDRQTDQSSSTPNDVNIQEILRNVPKSLTITIA